ncbi:MAG: lysylphosphatidylglycerol synthase transmembrane domain-containing protein [Acidimicrobiales bacterium]
MHRPLRHALGLVVVVLVIYVVVLPQVAGPRRALHLLGSVNVAYVVVGVVAEAGALTAYACLTGVVILRRRPSLGRLVRIDLSTLAVSHVLPAGTVGGAGLGYRLLTEAGVSGSDAGFAVATQGIGSALVLNVLLWLALLVSIPQRGFNPLYGTAAVVGAVGLTGFGLLVALLVLGESHADRALRAVARRLPLLREERVAGLVEQVAARLRELLRQPRLLGRAVAWAGANWLADAASLWVLLAAFAHRFPSPVDLLVAYGLANVLAAIPLTPAGLGVVEWVVPTIMVGFGMTRGAAVLGMVAWRLVSFWLPIPVGAAAYLSLRLEPGASRARKLAELNALALSGAPETEAGQPADPPDG